MSDTARRTCLFFLDRLGSEIERLNEGSFPGHHTGPRKWLQFTRGLVDTALGYLQRAADPTLQPEEAAKLLSEAELLGGTAYDWVNFAAGTDARNIPHQVVGPFRRWVEGLLITNTLFFRAEHLSNYELGTLDASRSVKGLPHPSESLKKAAAEIVWPVQRVTVPSQSMAMLPHFAVVAHELGHSIQDKILPDFTGHEQDQAQIFTRVRSRITNNGGSFGHVETLRCQEIAGYWLNEMKADAVGYILTGPAFFFALSSFLELTGAVYGIGPTHPPSDLRLSQLIQALSSRGSPSFAQVFQTLGINLEIDLTCPNLSYCPKADTLFIELQQGDNAISMVDAAICVELIQFFNLSAPKIYTAAEQYISNIAPQLVYTPSAFATDINRHLELLLTLVPPIEYRDGDVVRATELASILNIGWVVLLKDLGRMPKMRTSAGRNETAVKMERLHELLLKAVELSEARRLWEEQIL